MLFRHVICASICDSSLEETGGVGHWRIHLGKASSAALDRKREVLKMRAESSSRQGADCHVLKGIP